MKFELVCGTVAYRGRQREAGNSSLILSFILSEKNGLMGKFAYPKCTILS